MSRKKKIIKEVTKVKKQGYDPKHRLQVRLKQEIRFRKRCQRQNKNNQTSTEAKVSALLKNVRVPEIVKKKLLLSEVITKHLKDRYSNLKKHSEKKKYYEIVHPNTITETHSSEA
ncbi:unnamed protein product [Pieris brassicae]|uniref:Uncharacterized protein n=1 Tax=Pieris brassicae TaxID=7116 RepID=A0A9P0XAH2_PIEBR|nr:unnamed protein product [Pieris brassicae]